MSNPFEFRSMFNVNILNNKLTKEGVDVDWDKEDEYRRIFEAVQDKDDYKMPIPPIHVMTRVQADLLAEAIMYFVGGVEVKPITKYLKVVGYILSSKGYYHYVGS